MVSRKSKIVSTAKQTLHVSSSLLTALVGTDQSLMTEVLMYILGKTENNFRYHISTIVTVSLYQ